MGVSVLTSIRVVIARVPPDGRGRIVRAGVGAARRARTALKLRRFSAMVTRTGLATG